MYVCIYIYCIFARTAPELFRLLTCAGNNNKLTTCAGKFKILATISGTVEKRLKVYRCN